MRHYAGERQNLTVPLAHIDSGSIMPREACEGRRGHLTAPPGSPGGPRRVNICVCTKRLSCANFNRPDRREGWMLEHPWGGAPSVASPALPTSSVE